MKKAILSLGLVSALVFTVNALILTGHLSPDRFVSDPRASSLAEASTGQNDMHAALPQTPDLDDTGYSAPLPAEIEDLQDGDLDAPRLRLASTAADRSHYGQYRNRRNRHECRGGAVRPVGGVGSAVRFPARAPRSRRRARERLRQDRRYRQRRTGLGRRGGARSGPGAGAAAEAQLYATATVDQPAVSKPREKGRWARKGGRRGGLFGRLIGRR